MSFMKQQRRAAMLWLMARFGVATEVFYPHGVEVHLPKGSDLTLRYNLARKRPYEFGESLLIRKYLQRGNHVIELGGCVGVISALIRDTIGPDARHIIVEAQKALLEVCMANATRAAAPGATSVIHGAVDYSGVLFVRFVSGHNAHVGHVAQPGEDGAGVPVITLSSLMQDFPQSGEKVLICDIEGAELALCKAEMTKLDQFSTIIMERHPDIYEGGLTDYETIETDLAAAGFVPVETIDQVTCFRKA